jgi:hypothetical protein
MAVAMETVMAAMTPGTETATETGTAAGTIMGIMAWAMVARGMREIPKPPIPARAAALLRAAVARSPSKPAYS